jgi:hypothetical protein
MMWTRRVAAAGLSIEIRAISQGVSPRAEASARVFMVPEQIFVAASGAIGRELK